MDPTPTPGDRPRPAMHWARWGDPAREAPLSASLRELVEAFLGPLTERPAVDPAAVRLRPAALGEEELAGLRAVVGPDHVHTDDGWRLARTRGKSTPDLLLVRAGDAGEAPDAVVQPGGHAEVLELLRRCAGLRVAVVPFGGGTSVVGGLAGPEGGPGGARERYAGVVALDLRRMRRLLDVDEESGTATFEAGTLGPEAEELLAPYGLTVGHFPQSFRYATLGGFAATRSSGQSSAGYGRFDAMVVGLVVATPEGELRLGVAPATAAGPDLRQLVLGSEGAYGVITELTVRVRRVPPVRVYEGWRFAAFDDGVAAMRALAQSDALPTVLRLSDETETAVNLARPAAAGEAGGEEGGCLLLAGYEGTAARVDRLRAEAAEVLHAHRGRPLGEEVGEEWAATRFDGPYLRDSLLDAGVLVETLETATFWSRLRPAYDAVRAALTGALSGQGTPPLVLCHVSHVYPTGASLYFTVAARELDDGVGQWRAAKAAATDALVAAGATVTHHHAVGRDHRPWLAAEVGGLGVEVLRAVKERLDPAGVLNPGVLIP